jgi:hypothetical protein
VATLDEFADDLAATKELLAAERVADNATRERDRWKSRAAVLAERLEEVERLLGIHEAAGDLKPPKWTTPAKPKRHNAIVASILSDLHFDEVVRPDEIGGLNAYNRHIAEVRLRLWADKLIEVSRHYIAGVDLEGAVVMLGGDIFSGNLHDLAETNEDTMMGSLLHWSEQIAAALTLVADEFGRVHVPVVVGNHGRMTRKPRTKLRARDNVDWALGHLVARHFHGDKRVTVTVTDDPDQLVPIYDTMHLLTHGDQVTGGGGIGGIWPPIMRMAARKQQRYSGVGTPFDVIVMGHWHQLISAPTQGLIVNGSLKGYDEYASLNNFRAEPPQQAMWLVTPERGITMTAPIFCHDRKAEGW